MVSCGGLVCCPNMTQHLFCESLAAGYGGRCLANSLSMLCVVELDGRREASHLLQRLYEYMLHMHWTRQLIALDDLRQKYRSVWHDDDHIASDQPINNHQHTELLEPVYGHWPHYVGHCVH
jgi:hypothetical protein